MGTTITRFDPAEVDRIAERLGMHPNQDLAERAGAEAAWSGFGEYDTFADVLRGNLALIHDYGEWPYWAHWAVEDTGGAGIVATYCEGDWYLYRFATAEAASEHVASEHENSN